MVVCSRQSWFRRTLTARLCSLHTDPSRSDKPIRTVMNSTYFGLLAEFGEANIPLDKVALKYFGLSPGEAKRRAPARLLPCRVFRLGSQKSPWLVSAADLAELIDRQTRNAGRSFGDR